MEQSQTCGFHMFDVDVAVYSIPAITMSPSSYSSSHQPPLTHTYATHRCTQTPLSLRELVNLDLLLHCMSRPLVEEGEDQDAAW